MKYNIRGGLGNQVLELLGCYADAWKRKEEIEQVAVCFLDDDLEHNQHNWVSQLFDLPFPVIHSSSTEKFNIWRSDKMETIVRKYMRWPKLKVEPIKCNRIIQIRFSDRNPVSISQYARVIRKGDILIGENQEACQQIANLANVEMSYGDAIYNWRLCLGAKEIISPLSSFSLSAHILGKKGKLGFFRIQDGPLRVPDEAMDTIDHIKDQLPKFNWI